MLTVALLLLIPTVAPPADYPAHSNPATANSAGNGHRPFTIPLPHKISSTGSLAEIDGGWCGQIRANPSRVTCELDYLHATRSGKPGRTLLTVRWVRAGKLVTRKRMIRTPSYQPATIPPRATNPDNTAVGWCGRDGAVALHFTPEITPRQREIITAGANTAGRHAGVVFAPSTLQPVATEQPSLLPDTPRTVTVTTILKAKPELWKITRPNVAAWAVTAPSDRSLPEHQEDDRGTVAYRKGVLSSENLPAITVHEFGHILGLGHATSGDSTMTPTITTAGYTLTQSDITALRSVRDAGCSSP